MGSLEEASTCGHGSGIGDQSRALRQPPVVADIPRAGLRSLSPPAQIGVGRRRRRRVGALDSPGS